MHLAAMSSGLRRRLLLLLLVPLTLLAVINTWFDYRSADNAALQQDRQLLQLAPLLADSVVAPGKTAADPPLLLRAPAIEDFLKESEHAAFGVADLDGQVLLGADWLTGLPPTTTEPEFASEEHNGVVYRIVSQRVRTAGGELVMRLADGSDPRQQWLAQVLQKVLLPNLILMALGVLVINWAVGRALAPLLMLKNAVEHRSPRDLSPLDAEASPEEVRPLVQSLNRLLALVHAQAQSQARFVADAAHQLRTPLAGLQSQIEALAQSAEHVDEVRDVNHELIQNGPAALIKESNGAIFLDATQVQRLRAAARRTTQLANQLLALSRVDARNPAAQSPEHVDLKALCEGLLEDQLDAAAAKSIDLGLEAQPVRVWGQMWLLRELLSNLLDNAIKYTPAGGTVTLRCGHTGPERAPMLEVEDNGPGIAPEYRQCVLDRFFRVPGSPTEGNGLGLAIADEIARVHGGQLQVGEGAAGCGARFTLVLLCENEIDSHAP
jgi:two-component system sensor histidine kinase TctE